MDKIGPGAVARRAQRGAGELVPAVIVEIGQPVRRGRPAHGRDAIGDHAELDLRVSQRQAGGVGFPSIGGGMERRGADALQEGYGALRLAIRGHRAPRRLCGRLVGVTPT